MNVARPWVRRLSAFSFLCAGAVEAQVRATAFDRVELQATGSEGGPPPGLIERTATEPDGVEGVAVVPPVHEVKEGETLWDICERYFGSPWHWPKLWALNPHVTNPHWLYPGDRIRLLQGDAPMDLGAADSEEMWSSASVTSGAKETEGGIERVARVPADTLFLRQHAFVEGKELEAAGKIVGARDDKMLFASQDDVYVELTEKKLMRPGNRFMVYEPIEGIQSPADGRDLGSLVEVLGTIEVREVSSAGIARASLTDLIRPAERGMRVGPVRQLIHRIRPRRNSRELEGTVAASLPTLQLLGTDAVVIVDRGTTDGVKAGNRFLVMRTGDRLAQKATKESTFPVEAIAEILVLDVRKEASIGLITRSRMHAEIGDHVWMKQGY